VQYKVPSICFEFGGDGNFVGNALEAAGNGIFISKSQLSAEIIVRSIEQLLHSESRQRRTLVKMAEVLRSPLYDSNLNVNVWLRRAVKYGNNSNLIRLRMRSTNLLTDLIIFALAGFLGIFALVRRPIQRRLLQRQLLHPQ